MRTCITRSSRRPWRKRRHAPKAYCRTARMGIRDITGTPGNRKLRNRTDDGKFFKAKFVYFFHAASGIPFRVLATFGHLRTHSVECSKLGKTRIIEDARRGVVRNTGFCGQNCRSLFYPELSCIGFSEYPLSPSFSVTAGDYGGVPDLTPRLPDALHCAWRAACRRSCGRARALHRPLR